MSMSVTELEGYPNDIHVYKEGWAWGLYAEVDLRHWYDGIIMWPTLKEPVRFICPYVLITNENEVRNEST